MGSAVRSHGAREFDREQTPENEATIGPPVRLLFDVHVARAAVAALRKIAPQIQAEHIARWQNGKFVAAVDEEILAACHAENRILVTYDLATIPDLLRSWISEDRSHSGVIFCDENTVKPNYPGDAALAIAALTKEIGPADTTNLIRFLRPPGQQRS
jgi:hypothetical protein